MIALKTTQIVTAALNSAHSKPSLMAPVLMVIMMSLPLTAKSEVYRIDLKDNSKVLSTRKFDTSKTGVGVSHVTGGIAFELADPTASCGVFIQSQSTDALGTVKPQNASNVLVSIVETAGPIESKTVTSNSALLAKQKIRESDRNVFPNSEGRRSVSVEDKKLRRSCTVSVL